MNLLKNTISILFAAATVVSSTFVVVQPSIADSSSSVLAPSMLKRSVVNRSMMGNVMITNKEGKVTTVDKTWQFIKDDNGKLRIVLHHSSLPYAGR